MIATILNSPVAVQASIQVVRAFVKLREILATHKDLARKLNEMEREYDAQFKVVFDAIRQLTPLENFVCTNYIIQSKRQAFYTGLPEFKEPFNEHNSEKYLTKNKCLLTII